MNQPGWVLFCEEGPADIDAMPQQLRRAVLNFLSALAIEVGSAVDAGKTPPGHQLDELGTRYSIVVQGEPVIAEYVTTRAPGRCVRAHPGVDRLTGARTLETTTRSRSSSSVRSGWSGCKSSSGGWASSRGTFRR
ncbi:hypothetical protein ACFWDI_08230 [Streptomyces sp. NPDC060064]|uniref:hypothetical protein n=1 Tax=Streptomyces sp. NPDC060064 TaxID=3347049 RepID=UPI00369577B9